MQLQNAIQLLNPDNEAMTTYVHADQKAAHILHIWVIPASLVVRS